MRVTREVIGVEGSKRRRSKERGGGDFVQGPRSMRYRGTSLIRSRIPPQDHDRTLGMVLLKGPAGWRFLKSEVHL